MEKEKSNSRSNSSSKSQSRRRKSKLPPSLPDIDDNVLFKIIYSETLTFEERMQLRLVSKRFIPLIYSYYSRDEIIAHLSYNNLLRLQKLFRNKPMYLQKITNELKRIEDIATHFMGNNSTGRINDLIKKIKDKTINVATAELIDKKLNDYINENYDYFYPENQLGQTVQSTRDLNDIRKKIAISERFINKERYSNEQTSSVGNYRDLGFGGIQYQNQ